MCFPLLHLYWGASASSKWGRSENFPIECLLESREVLLVHIEFQQWEDGLDSSLGVKTTDDMFRADLKTSSEAVWMGVLIRKSPGIFNPLKRAGVRKEDNRASDLLFSACLTDHFIAHMAAGGIR